MFENEWIMVKLPNICCVFDGKNTVLLGLKKKGKKTQYHSSITKPLCILP